MDRGMASAENIAWLRETGRRYIVGTPKSELRKLAPALAEKGTGARSAMAWKV